MGEWGRAQTFSFSVAWLKDGRHVRHFIMTLNGLALRIYPHDSFANHFLFLRSLVMPPPEVYVFQHILAGCWCFEYLFIERREDDLPLTAHAFFPGVEQIDSC